MADNEIPLATLAVPAMPAQASEPARVESLAAIQQQRQAELQVIQTKFEHSEKQLRIAQRSMDNQRDRSHLLLMQQVPKLLGAAVVGAMLAYILPLGGSR